MERLLKHSEPLCQDYQCIRLAYERITDELLKGTVPPNFPVFFPWISFPQTPEYPIKVVLIFFENSHRYSQLSGKSVFDTNAMVHLDLQIFLWISKKFEMTLMLFWWAWGKMIYEKNEAKYLVTLSI